MNKIHVFSRIGTFLHCNTADTRRRLISTLVMIKFVILLIVVFSFQAIANVSAQHVNLKLRNKSLSTALEEIQKQTKVDFVYNELVLKMSQPVSVVLQNSSIESAMKELFANQPLAYEIKDNIIIIKPRPEAQKGTKGATATDALETTLQQQIRGTVVNQDGQALVGASVFLLNAANERVSQTNTGVNGFFVLSSTDQGTQVEITYVGYISKRFDATANMGRLVLLSATSDLDEVMVVAYGVAKKSTFTGSASVVKSEQLEKISGTGFVEALQGMSAGVNITNNEGSPGGNTRIQIRGISSMSGASNPLYVVDGMPFDGELTSIAPGDIETITVLKDAAASSLYGSRAANGVVVITTKSGKSDKAQINVRSNWGTSDLAVGYPEKADPEQHLLYTWEGMYYDQKYKYGKNDQEAGDWASDNVLGKILRAVQNSSGQTTYVSPFRHINEPYVLHDGTGNPYINPNLEMIWAKEDWDVYQAVYSRKLRQDYAVDIGGTAQEGKVNYFLSAGSQDDNGYANRQYYKRYNLRSNVSRDLTDWLQIGGNIAYSSAKQNLSGATRALVFTTSLQSPWLRNVDNTDWVYSEKTGERMYNYGAYTNNYFGIHPFVNGGDYWDNYNDEGFSNLMMQMISSRFYADFTLPLNLKFKSSISLDNNQRTVFGYNSAVHGPGQLAPYGVTVLTSGGSASRTNNEHRSTTFNNILSWDQSLGEHNFAALAGQEVYIRDFYYNYGIGEGIMQIGQYELGSTTRNWKNNSYFDKYRLMSFLGKVDYNYAYKYFLSASARRDGSSRFSPDNRWGNFYSAGASWKINEENFLKDTPWLNNLLLRGSYGTTGNDRLITRTNIGTPGAEILYAYQGTYSADDLYTVAGLRPATFPTPDLKWEKNKQFNVGVDFGLFNRVNATVEYYSRVSQDLLYYKNYPLSAQSGAAVGINTNLGSLQNSGFEFTVNVDAVRKENFKWSVDANFSTLKNEITHLPGGDFTYVHWFSGYKVAEGKSLYEFYMPKHAGVNPETGNLQYWIQDGSDSWIKTDDFSQVKSTDYQFVGSALPKGYGSLTNSFNYKNLDFSFMFYYSIGGKMYDYSYAERTALRGGVSMIPDLVGDRWTQPGDNATIPRWSNDDYVSTRRATDYYLFDNSYIRLRNVMLGYQVPTSLLNRLSIANLRLFVSADNLLTFGSAKNRYSDPETGLSGNNYNGNGDTDNGIQGSRRTFTGGLHLSF